LKKYGNSKFSHLFIQILFVSADDSFADAFCIVLHENFFYFSKINISDGIQVFSFSIEKISKKYVKWFLMMCRNPVLGTRYRTGGHLTLALVPKKSLILLCLQKNIETRPFLKFLCALPGDRPVATGGHSVAVPSQIFVPPKFCCAQKNLS